MTAALTDKSVVVTRSRDQSGRLADLLEAEGGHVIEFPTIEIRPVAHPPHIGPIADYDWILFTSGNAVRYFFDALPKLNLPPDFEGVKIGAVGPSTRVTLVAQGVRVDLVPERNLAEALVEALEDAEPDLNGKKILLPRGNLADDLLPDRLRASGADVSVAVFYQNVVPELGDEKADALVAAQPDAVTFTSASTARNFAAILGPKRLPLVVERTVFASIGPKTSAAMRAAGMPVTVEATEHTLDGLVTALKDALGEFGSGD